MIKEVLKIASSKLAFCCENPQKEARILLEYFLQKDSIYLKLCENDILDNKEDFFKLIQRRVNHEPLEYITNKVSFYSSDFFIKKNVLIPRAETELLVDKAIEVLSKIKNPKVAEIGVGSGIISIILAKKIQNIQIIATDISQDALDVSKINLLKFKLLDKVKLVKTSYLNGINEHFDLIISNPPYIKNNEKLPKNVLNEPHTALFGGQNGHEILEEIIKLTKKRKINNLICEFGYNQKAVLENILQNHEFKFSFYKDLSGFDRYFYAREHL